MTDWVQTALTKRAPELDALHMETLAYAIGSTLNGMPAAFFDEVATLARKMGAKRLAEFHRSSLAWATWPLVYA
jgi:hypothetical protein